MSQRWMVVDEDGSRLAPDRNGVLWAAWSASGHDGFDSESEAALAIYRSAVYAGDNGRPWAIEEYRIVPYRKPAPA